jgi:hypothetical protein
MEITLSEFDIEKYTRRRMRQIKGQTPEYESIDPFIERYTRKRMRELRLERELNERKISLDKMLFAGYTVATMEAYRPDERS